MLTQSRSDEETRKFTALGKTWYRRRMGDVGIEVWMLEEDRPLSDKELVLKYPELADFKDPIPECKRELAWLFLCDGQVIPHWKDEEPSGVTVTEINTTSRLMRGGFGAALQVLNNGGKVARKGWNGKNMCIFLDECIPRAEKHDGVRGRYIRPCLVMIDAQGYLVPGWLASQVDMLAEDWFEVTDDEST